MKSLFHSNAACGSVHRLRFIRLTIARTHERADREQTQSNIPPGELRSLTHNLLRCWVSNDLLRIVKMTRMATAEDGSFSHAGYLPRRDH
jgi:hypothetical protein